MSEHREPATSAEYARSLEPLVESMGAATWLLVKTIELIGVKYQGSVPGEAFVCCKLMNRVATDLRCIAQAVYAGYPLQAGTLASSAFETILTAAYIGNDAERGRRWHEHEDPTRSFMKTGDLLWEVLGDEAAVTNGYEIYAQLCMCKHANPGMQRQFGIDYNQESGAFRMTQGPCFDDQSLLASWYAVVHLTQVVVAGVEMVTQAHLDPSQKQLLVEVRDRLIAQLMEYQKAARRRWGNKDPFPGKWKTPKRPKGVA